MGEKIIVAKYNIQVEWTQTGTLLVEADSLEEAKEKVYGPEPEFSTDRIDSSYVDDSFTVVDDGCYKVNK